MLCRDRDIHGDLREERLARMRGEVSEGEESEICLR